MHRVRFLVAVFALLVLTTAGLRPPLAYGDAKKPTYDEDVLPILKLSCVNCHGAEKQKGGLNLATFATAMQGGSSGAVVAPGDSDKSRLYALAAHKDEPKMPP